MITIEQASSTAVQFSWRGSQSRGRNKLIGQPTPRCLACVAPMWPSISVTEPSLFDSSPSEAVTHVHAYSEAYDEYVQAVQCLPDVEVKPRE